MKTITFNNTEIEVAELPKEARETIEFYEAARAKYEEAAANFAKVKLDLDLARIAVTVIDSKVSSFLKEHLEKQEEKSEDDSEDHL